jgi:hypothetical protein
VGLAVMLMRHNKNGAIQVSTICVALILPTIFFGQAEQFDNESTIRQVMTQAYQQTYTSTGQKQLRKLGDATAVALTKVIGGRALNQHDVQPVLLVLELSFSNLRFVEISADRQPRTTLVLLNYLDSVTSNTELKAKIGSTRTYVLGQYQKSQKEGDSTTAPESR